MWILWWCWTHCTWKSLLHNKLTMSVSFTLLVQFKTHSPLAAFFFFSTRFTCCSLFHFVFTFLALEIKTFHALHLITNGFLSVFLFGVFGYCNTSWMGEMCLSLRLFSDPVCMAVLVSGFSSRVPEVISAMSRLNVSLFAFLFSWPIFLDSALLHCCYLEVLSL